MDHTLRSTTTPGQSGPGSNGNEEVQDLWSPSGFPKQQHESLTEGVRGLVDYVAGNEHGEPSSNPEQRCLNFT